jgi:D-methionine transport system substrate-binding protein
MLEKLGLITLKQGVDPQQIDVKDIVSNPKNLKFDANYEASLLPKIYKNGEGDAVLINSNYAIDNGLNPMKDAIAHEPSDPKSPYVNIIAVRQGDENKPAIKTLVQVLQSKEIQDWITKQYKGAVLPVSK